MTFLSENHDGTPSRRRGGRSLPCGEFRRSLILLFDLLLELEHHRASGIDNLDMITTGKFISLWGLSMSAQQHLHIVKLAHLLVVDGDESHLAQTIALHAVMHDIAKAIEGAPLCQLFLGFLDGGGYSEAEATAFIDFNLYHSNYFLSRIA